ncbi:hypothetical protein N658DRAFT_234493 [Parathielavia hyrcaniae]|uniref:Uncharacterized protein n=1 Tax=Parathielavia hyrcaniae TaxID=113614 RepID=A0AAN6T3L9_9PEZI|nr:hypothetical protein N658DRAFT_234493 [Parathielavia hyrcaniae]
MLVFALAMKRTGIRSCPYDNLPLSRSATLSLDEGPATDRTDSEPQGLASLSGCSQEPSVFEMQGKPRKTLKLACGMREATVYGTASWPGSASRSNHRWGAIVSCTAKGGLTTALGRYCPTRLADLPLFLRFLAASETHALVRACCWTGHWGRCMAWIDSAY